MKKIFLLLCFFFLMPSISSAKQVTFTGTLTMGGNVSGSIQTQNNEDYLYEYANKEVTEQIEKYCSYDVPCEVTAVLDSEEFYIQKIISIKTLNKK